MHESETTQDAAIREVREKTGLAITPPELCGISEIIIRDPDETLLSHVIAYVYTYEIPGDTVVPESLAAFPRAEIAQAQGLAPDFLPVFHGITHARHASVALETYQIVT